jgi:hypothetical protein
MPSSQLARPTRLRPARMPSRASMEWMRSAPYVQRGPLPDRLDPLSDRRISHRPGRRRSAGTAAEGRHRFADRGEQRGNREGVTMRFRKRLDLRRVGVGLLAITSSPTSKSPVALRLGILLTKPPQLLGPRWSAGHPAHDRPPRPGGCGTSRCQCAAPGRYRRACGSLGRSKLVRPSSELARSTCTDPHRWPN